MSVGGARRHRYRSIRQQQQFAAYSAGIDKYLFFRRQNSRFRKRFSKIGLSAVAMLRFLIGILRASLVQIDTEMAEKYANVANQRYAVSAHWKICRKTCVSNGINGPGDLDL